MSELRNSHVRADAAQVQGGDPLDGVNVVRRPSGGDFQGDRQGQVLGRSTAEQPAHDPVGNVLRSPAVEPVARTNDPVGNVLRSPAAQRAPETNG